MRPLLLFFEMHRLPNRHAVSMKLEEDRLSFACQRYLPLSFYSLSAVRPRERTEERSGRPFRCTQSMRLYFSCMLLDLVDRRSLSCRIRAPAYV